MAATFLAALKERYDVIVTDGLPEMGEFAWVGIIPETGIRTLPNVLCRHGGEKPVYQKEGVSYEVGEAEFEVYAASLAEVDRLGTLIKDGFGPNNLTITNKRVELYRVNYMLTDSGMRGPMGQYIYRAWIPYRAEISTPGS